MSPEQREAMIDAAWHALPVLGPLALDDLTAAGFSISLASVRDHTNCQTCRGTELVCGSGHPVGPPRLGCHFHHKQHIHPCPGGSPVVWSVEERS